MLQVVPRRRLRITVERVVLESTKWNREHCESLGLCACFRSITVDTARYAYGYAERAGRAPARDTSVSSRTSHAANHESHHSGRTLALVCRTLAWGRALPWAVSVTRLAETSVCFSLRPSLSPSQIVNKADFTVAKPTFTTNLQCM